MNKTKIIISIAQLTFAIITFVVVSLAWFSMSTEVETVPFEMRVGSGIIASYEIKFYTVDKVYKFDHQLYEIVVWNSGSSSWISPTYNDPELINFGFEGIFLNEYDPLIYMNNVNNLLYIELILVYDVDVDKTISVDLESDIDLATSAISTFGYSTSKPYFLSEVLYVQQMETDTYANNPEGTNIYSQLKNDFEQVDVNLDLIYSKYSFYTQIDEPINQPETYYHTSISTPSVNLLSSQETSEVYIYLKFSYIDSIIEYIISEENVNIAVNNGNGIIFFQDIKIIISEVTGS